MRKLAMMLSACMASVPAYAGLSCNAETTGTATQLVELYTSEGCSSCPPADQWLSNLNADDTLIPLAFHVDYWDYLGWRDRFSNSRFTQRQREIGLYNRQNTIYTPEVVVNGRELRQWPRGLPRAGSDSLLDFTIKAQFDTNKVSAQLASEQNWPAYGRAFIAITESKLYTAVARGENRGRSLRHDHVVRAYAGPFSPEQTLQAELPDDLRPEHAALVVWVEQADTGQTMQALRVPLDSCQARS